MTTPLHERFWAKVDKRGPDDCWLWTAGLSEGYGQIGAGGRGGRNLLAHRLAYEMLVGPIPEGLQIDHLCRVRRCVNPKHMEPVTRQVNVIRGWQAAGVPASVDACPQGHEYDEFNTIAASSGSRTCRECNRLRSSPHVLTRQRKYGAKPTLRGSRNQRKESA